MTTTDSPTTTDAAADTTAREVRLADWERRTSAWIIVSALLPIATALSPEDTRSTLKVAINIVCWLVFVVDLVVHVRLMPGYLRTRRGKFDLVVVLITAPWFLFFGGNSKFVLFARLARLGRIVMAGTRSRKLKHLASQLGNVALYALGLLLACALIVKAVEPASSGFATYGDAVWWGFVTLTTVGYGDLYPVTTAGRIAAIVLMLGGVAFLGTLAGTLSAFFGVGEDGKPVELDESGDVVVREAEAEAEVEATATTASDLQAEVVALRAAVSDLVARLDGSRPSS